MIRGYERRMKRKKISHLFSKIMVVFCIMFSSMASVWSLWIADKHNIETTGLLTVILAFFGGELLMMCLRQIMGTKGASGKNNGIDEGGE